MDLNRLHRIDEQLTKSEVAALKFLCMEHLGRKRLETVKDAKDLFLRLSEQSVLDDECFLPDLLYTIGRYDLLSILGTNRENVSKSIMSGYSAISAYRKMLFQLSEDITEENLHDIKFLLSKLPKKLSTATFLDVMTEMEKMEMLGEDNLDTLENVLNKCSKDLAYKVQKFKNTSRNMDQNHITELAQEESIGLPVSEEEESTNRSSISQEESFSLPLSFQDESISLPNLSITETNPPSSIMNVVDTDSQSIAISEISPINGVNDEFYPMTRKPLGFCLIINNYLFKTTPNLGNRSGTDADKDALTEVFQKMNFIVEERRDLKQSEMVKALKEFADMDHSRMDAFVCCILSHGQQGSVIGVDGEAVQIRELTQPIFHCKSLTSKPKLFFIQACQGNQLHHGVWKEDGNDEAEYEADAQIADFRSVPLEADFLIGMATVESYKSYRHTKMGSIFIQELCNQLKLGCPKKEDILSILTKVNRNVSSQVLNRFKQMPEPRYTLTKKLVFPWTEQESLI